MLADGDSRGRLGACDRRGPNARGWRPYETAQARALLGVAYRRVGDEDSATRLEAALATFEGWERSLMRSG